MSTEVKIPTPEDKSRYDTAKKELLQALAKKRLVDKQLVRLRRDSPRACAANPRDRRNSKSRYSTWRAPISQTQRRTVAATLYKDLMGT